MKNKQGAITAERLNTNLPSAEFFSTFRPVLEFFTVTHVPAISLGRGLLSDKMVSLSLQQQSGRSDTDVSLLRSLELHSGISTMKMEAEPSSTTMNTFTKFRDVTFQSSSNPHIRALRT
jgi:hypothetical protein